MKNIIKLIGLFTLIGFSFFYTDKVIEVIQDEDEIMIKLKEIKDDYYIEPINATVLSNTIIPGIKGREINIEASYKKMRELGIFSTSKIIYNEIDPDIRLENNKDKFIVLGNSTRGNISLIFILNNDKYFTTIDKVLTDKNIIANFFVDYTYLINNSTSIKENSHHEYYSYGNNGKYEPDTILFSNNLISRISNNDAIYCLSSNMSKDILELCSKNNLYTINPNIIGDKTPYKVIKTHLTSGSMILLRMNKETTNELSTIIDYIEGRGYKIVGLSKLLSENLE